MTIPATLAALTVPVGELRPYGRNPRRGNLDAIKASLEAHGQYRPVVARRGTGEVLAGNHTLRAAVQLGWAEIAATYVDVDDDEAARIVLVDNRTNDLAGYDDTELAALLDSLPDLGGTGFDTKDLDALLKSIERSGRDTEPGSASTEPLSRCGDLYALGEHRLLCGDSSDREALDRVYGGGVDVLLTDPPYGIDLMTDYTKHPSGNGKELLRGQPRRTYRPVIGDDEPFDATELAGYFAGAREQFWFGANYYRRTLSASDMDGSWLVWDKRNEATDTMIGSGFELIWSARAHKQDLLRHFYNGAFGRDAANRVHPTQKPVNLLEELLNRWSSPGEHVADPFGGSGSALIACENLHRRCSMIELDPAYCDVIVDRWQRHTGQEAEHVG